MGIFVWDLGVEFDVLILFIVLLLLIELRKVDRMLKLVDDSFGSVLESFVKYL